MPLAGLMLVVLAAAAAPPAPKTEAPKADAAKADAAKADAAAAAPKAEAGAAEASLPLEKLKLPAGFKISVFARVKGARSLVRGAKGTIFVGTRDASRTVYAVVDADNDGRAERVMPLLTGLNRPNGVAIHDGALYVGEKTRITRYDAIEENLDKPPAAVVVEDGQPDGQQHGFKYMAFGPDGWLYFGVGAPCNICDHEKDEPRYASITRITTDGKKSEVYASGVRNTVGFDWHPQTKELWFTDNGRDWLNGEQYSRIPADELNVATKKGQHFGYPFCHQGDIVNTGQDDTASGRDQKIAAPADACSKYEAPVMKLDPHVAALGMKFYTADHFPSTYKNAIFIAEHGSWNRSKEDGPIGYRVKVARPEAKGAERYETFLDGFLEGSNAWGRPVDVLVLPDGSLLVSDDKAGAIYRVTYDAKAR
jgi:glucose/arabinose dehydrogenase